MQYTTIAMQAEDELVEKKSRFIARIYPCTTEEEALRWIEKQRKEFWDARHNVYAYVLREPAIKRCSDDGEPQGTAGKPVLEIIETSGLQDVCIVVTRYFGGTLLGTGGLIRAYSHSAKLAAVAAPKKSIRLCHHYSLHVPYTFYGKLQNMLPQYPLQVLSTDFTDAIELTCMILQEYAEGFCHAVIEASNATVQPVLLQESMEDCTQIIKKIEELQD